MKRGKPMKRTALKRGTSTLKRGRVKASNPKRKQKAFARAYGGEARVLWLKSRPCCITGILGSIECVHVRGGGAGRKADAKWLVPMSGALHRELHRIGKSSFEHKWRVDLDSLASFEDALWLVQPVP